MRLSGYRGLDDRHAVITCYEGGKITISPVGENQVRVGPHEFTEWEDLGGAFAGGPTAVKNARGQLEVFARGVDKHLYRRVSSGDCCAFDAAKWECLGGCFSSKPHALLSSQGMVHVFARGCEKSFARSVGLRSRKRRPSSQPGQGS